MIISTEKIAAQSNNRMSWEIKQNESQCHVQGKLPSGWRKVSEKGSPSRQEDQTPTQGWMELAWGHR